jgi:membrane peptidoglycan carboxypeptidase
MSDHPKSNQHDQEETGSWHEPQARGEWHPPEQPAEPVTGWRVPTLPSNMDVVPDQKGMWHLPQPEDTVFTPDDVSEVLGVEKKPADAIDPIDALAEAVGGMAEPEEGVTETMPQKPLTPEDMMTKALEMGDEEDDSEAFSMSELVALASLVEETPKTEILPGASAPQIAPVMPTLEANEEETQTDYSALSPAERAIMQPTEVMPQAVELEDETTDVEAYAKKQLEQLSAGEDQAPPMSTMEGAAAGDPAAYAKQQLKELGISSEPADNAADYARQQLAQLGEVDEYTPTGQVTTPMDAQTAELAAKFRDTENRVRTLRNMYQSGQITRDDLQTQLRQYMVLDNNQVWWMMGVETDTWYKFENNQWVAATPPALAAQPRTGAPPTVTGKIDPSQVIQGSLPYLPSDQASAASPQEQTLYDSQQYDTGGISLDEDNMPLPRQVPVQDPYSTVVGQHAAYLDSVHPSEVPTVQNIPSVSEPTVKAQPVQYGAYDEGIQAPYDDTDYAPEYALDEDAPVYDDISRRRRRSTMRSLLLLAAVGLGVILIGMAGFVILAVSWYNGIVSDWEPQIVALQNYQPAFQTARILDAHGDLIAELTSQEGGARTEVDLKDISPEMIYAVIAMENERFYEDPGWDLFAIVRAFFQNVTSGEIESGASTVTQQIARNLVLQDAEVTAARKVNEIVIAGEIAKRYDKNFILKLYLNEVFFGNQSYGVEAAAEFYFGKTAADLNLAESALLAGLIQSPATFDPVTRRDAAVQRMKDVLDRMSRVGCLQFQHAPYDQEPYCIARNQIYAPTGDYSPELSVQVAPLEVKIFEPRQYDVKYPHFVNLVQAQIENYFGAGEMYRRGFTIRTTLVPELQNVAQDALVARLAALANTGLDTGAIMVTDPTTGAIRAMVGSPDFNNADIAGQLNNTLAYRQPGSSIKPIEYTAALEGVDKNGNGMIEQGEYYTPATILWDVQTTWSPNYTPVNYDNRYHGPVPVREALGNSYNVPAVKTYEFIGEAKFKDMAQRLGLTFEPDATFGLPTGVGATEVRLYDMMAAYGTLANDGRYVPLYMVESITDSASRPVEIPARTEPKQVIQPQVAFLMQSILSDDNARAAAFGRNSALTLPGYPTQNYVAAKTGTTDNNRDQWTLGFTKTAVVGVWMGRHDGQATLASGGFTSVAPVWNQVMQLAVAGAQPQQFTNPSSVVSGRICADTGTLADDTCANVRTEYYIITQPPPPADQGFVKTVEIDTWTGLIANQNCPDNKETHTFASISDTAAVNWLNTTAAGQLYAQQLNLPLPFESAPTAACEVGMIIPTARIIDPFDNKTIEGTVSITGQVSASPTEFSRYQLEYADVNNPETFQIIGQYSTQQQTTAGSVLATWNTTTVPNGTYILRLAVFAQNGGYLYRTVRVNINNQLPTPTPTVPALPPTSAPFTPIPFDTVEPTAGALTAPLEATPTVAVPSL